MGILQSKAAYLKIYPHQKKIGSIMYLSFAWENWFD